MRGKSKQEEYRQLAEKRTNAARIEDEKRKIEYVNQSIKRMAGLRTKEAWRSFVFLRREIKKLMRVWQTQVENPDTPENKRIYFLGCIYGAKIIFQISKNFVDMEKSLKNNDKGSILNFFKGGR